MAAQVAPFLPMGHGPSWSTHAYHHQPVLQLIPPNTLPHHTMASMQTPNTPSQPTSTGPWNPREDEILMAARRSGAGWSQIQEKHFPHKSANACRKRFERLQSKHKADEWDEHRLTELAVGYHELREKIWSPLAERTGEKWEHVEKACMNQGIRNLQNLAARPRHGNRGHSRYASRQEQHFTPPQDENDPHDDSGLGGMSGEVDSRRSSGGGMPGWAQILHNPQPPRGL